MLTRWKDKIFHTLIKRMIQTHHPVIVLVFGDDAPRAMKSMKAVLETKMRVGMITSGKDIQTSTTFLRDSIEEDLPSSPIKALIKKFFFRIKRKSGRASGIFVSGLSYCTNKNMREILPLSLVQACVVLSPFDPGAALSSVKKIFKKVRATRKVIVPSSDRTWQGQVRGHSSHDVFTYGLGEKTAIVSTEEVREMTHDGTFGLHFKLIFAGSVTPVFVPGGRDKDIHTLLAVAALSIALSFTPLEIAQGLEKAGVR